MVQATNAWKGERGTSVLQGGRAPEGPGEGPAAAIDGAGGVLGGEQHEVRVWPHHLSQLWHVQLPVVVQ